MMGGWSRYWGHTDVGRRAVHTHYVHSGWVGNTGGNLQGSLHCWGGPGPPESWGEWWSPACLTPGDLGAGGRLRTSLLSMGAEAVLSVLPSRKPTPSTLKAGELRTHVSRCQVCMRRT